MTTFIKGTNIGILTENLKNKKTNQMKTTNHIKVRIQFYIYNVNQYEKRICEKKMKENIFVFQDRNRILLPKKLKLCNRSRNDRIRL